MKLISGIDNECDNIDTEFLFKCSISVGLISEMSWSHRCPLWHFFEWRIFLTTLRIKQNLET